MNYRRLGWLAVALAVAGVVIAGYLTWVHYEGLTPFCAGDGRGCEQVQSSDYAKFAGVPVALLGLVGYLLILGALLLRGEAARIAAVFLVFGGWAFSAYLTYAELFIIGAICQWCVASFVVITALLAVTALRLLNAPPGP